MSIHAWIEFEKERPAEGQLVWYFFDCVGVHLGYYHSPAEFSSATGFGFLNWDVTHWMPAPALSQWKVPSSELLREPSNPDIVLALPENKFGRVFFKGSDRIIEEKGQFIFERYRRKRVPRSVDSTGFQVERHAAAVLAFLEFPHKPVMADLPQGETA